MVRLGAVVRTGGPTGPGKGGTVPFWEIGPTGIAGTVPFEMTGAGISVGVITTEGPGGAGMVAGAGGSARGIGTAGGLGIEAGDALSPVMAGGWGGPTVPGKDVPPGAPSRGVGGCRVPVKVGSAVLNVAAGSVGGGTGKVVPSRRAGLVPAGCGAGGRDGVNCVISCGRTVTKAGNVIVSSSVSVKLIAGVVPGRMLLTA